MPYHGNALIDSSGRVVNESGIPLTNYVTREYVLNDLGNAGTYYLGGFYDAPSAKSTLTIGATVTQTYGTAGNSKAARAFCVASGAGGADLVLTVSGATITDAGVFNGDDSEVIVADCDTATTDKYYETTKKWLGTITYTLTGAAGAFSFNYGFVKKDDFTERNFTVIDFGMTLLGGASESGFDISLLHHKTTGWTYSAAAFVPGSSTGVICSSLADHTATYDNFASGKYSSYHRTNLSTAVAGAGGIEGVFVKVTTAVNNSIKSGICHAIANLT